MTTNVLPAMDYSILISISFVVYFATFTKYLQFPTKLEEEDRVLAISRKCKAAVDSPAFKIFSGSDLVWMMLQVIMYDYT